MESEVERGCFFYGINEEFRVFREVNKVVFIRRVLGFLFFNSLVLVFSDLFVFLSFWVRGVLKC